MNDKLVFGLMELQIEREEIIKELVKNELKQEQLKQKFQEVR